MAATLEDRRLAIAAALRAVMSEPSPGPQSRVDSAAETATVEPAATSAAAPRVSLRAALAAEIDWDEPEHAEPLGDLDRSPADLRGLEDFDADWISPSVPPLELAGSMSRNASLALFGHA